jgi:restriction system protein
MGLEAIIKGWTGELKTKIVNGLSLDENYKIFNDIIIKTERGSTQIDHVIVSVFGIFVIETKDKSGWIFGDTDQDKWTQVIFGEKYKFQNPLRQNYFHTKTLSAFLGVDHDKIYSLIVFWGDCEFKTPMPDNVFKGGFLGGKLKNYIRTRQALLYSPEEVNRICEILIKVKDSQGFFSDWHHARELHEKYNNSSKCPKCGGDLIKRHSKANNEFWGCSNFPRCYYTKEI